MAGRLTDKQATFVANVTKGVRKSQAARLAGYSSPKVEVYRLMRLPHVVEALRERRDAALKGDLAALAVETMRDLMGDGTPAATRYQAARWVLEHAGHRAVDDQDRAATPLEEMDAGELAQAVASGMDALKELAGQLEGHHVVDGQARRVRSTEPKAALEVEEGADFLQ